MHTVADKDDVLTDPRRVKRALLYSGRGKGKESWVSAGTDADGKNLICMRGSLSALVFSGKLRGEVFEATWS